MANEHTINLSEDWEGWEGQWVKIKPHLPFAVRQKIDGAVASAQLQLRESATQALDIDFRPHDVVIAWVEHQVVEWHILGFDGEPIPCNRDGLLGDNTPPDLVEVIIGRMSDYYDEQRPPPFRRSADDS